MSSQLPQTKETLKQLSNRYAEDIHYAVADIKPNYGHGNTGSNYLNIHNNDVDFIYQSICYLRSWLQEPLFYDWSFYVTDARAIDDLDKAKADILDRYDKLKSIEPVDKEKNSNTYPLKKCLKYYKDIIEILNDIYVSQELIEFKKPNIIEENKKLKFDLWWDKRCRKLIIHLFSFFVFLAGVIIALIIKDNNDGWYIVVFLGIVTILFNLLFNNHQSFKDSWKIIRSSDREKLKYKYFKDPKMWQNI